MRAAALVGVLVLAKVLGLAERDLPHSAWLPSVLFFDDVVVGCVFWLTDRWLARPRALWILYWAIATWAALNIPVVRALSSPLTTQMIGAAGGALADSISHYLTWSNLLAVGVVIAAAAVLPGWFGRLRPLLHPRAGLAAVVFVAPGPWVVSGIDVRGLQRNALTSVVTTSFSRIETRAAAGEWRTSPFGSRPPAGLSSWRGAAVGRNVVLIVLESTAASYLRSYGAADDPMPNLTALASQAIQFDRTYAVYPESIKGLFAALCSRFPAFDVSAEAHARAACDPLAGTFAASGYRTALFHSGRFGYLGMNDVVSRQAFDTAEDAGSIGGHVESSFGVDDGSTVTRMLSWVDALPQDRRFFITYLPVAGHHPYATNEPGPFSGRGDLTAYKNALHEGDRSLGTLVDGLRRRGLDRRTLFVIFGDHGEAFGQHDGNRAHSLFIYDENVRVPLLMVMPGAITSPVSVSNVASVVDIAPTILELVGLARPARYEGESLLAGRDRMAMFFTDYSVGMLGLQDGCWKYHFEVDSHRSRLFDTCADPGEKVDRSHEHPERINAYRARVEQWSSATRAAILTR